MRYPLLTMRMLLAALGAALLAAPGGHPVPPSLADPERDPPPADATTQAQGTAPTQSQSMRQREPHEYALIAEDPDSGAELIGRRAPPWSFERWARGPAQSLESVRGKVVLLRWWTEGCMYCAVTLPEIEKLRKRYGPEGLLVIGVYHPKPPRSVGDRSISTAADRLGFAGPIAVDERWTTLKRYWLDGAPSRRFTSVSFLIGRDGLIRWVHGGGEYHPSDDPEHQRCDLEYKGLVSAIERALAPS